MCRLWLGKGFFFFLGGGGGGGGEVAKGVSQSDLHLTNFNRSITSSAL